MADRKYRGRRPLYDSVLLSVTERCHVGCAHCGFIGTRREREATLDELADWTDQVCRYGDIRRLIMTGGEPFERLDAMQLIVRTASGRVPIISAFTSSFWADSADAAKAVLSSLKGLNQLYLSSDSYHQKRVPYEHVHNAIQAALELGLQYITICITYANDAELHEVKRNYERWGERIAFHEDRVIPTPYLPKRVLQKQTPLEPHRSVIYGTTCYLQTPLINPDGDLYACHSGKAGAHRDIRSTPYFLGSLREEKFIDIAERVSRRWDYQFMRTLGPRGVAELAEDNPRIFDELGRATFSSPCDMCFSILKTDCGRETLLKKSSMPAVRDIINIRLAMGLGEDPIES